MPAEPTPRPAPAASPAPRSEAGERELARLLALAATLRALALDDGPPAGHPPRWS